MIARSRGKRVTCWWRPRTEDPRSPQPSPRQNGAPLPGYARRFRARKLARCSRFAERGKAAWLRLPGPGHPPGGFSVFPRPPPLRAAGRAETAPPARTVLAPTPRLRSARGVSAPRGGGRSAMCRPAFPSHHSLVAVGRTGRGTYFAALSLSGLCPVPRPAGGRLAASGTQPRYCT